MNGRLRENAATAAGQRVVAAAAAHDFDALADVFAEGYVEKIQDASRPAVRRDEMLVALRALLELPDALLETQPIATLGERLQLHHTHISASTGDEQPLVIDYISVIEVDADGRLVSTESFDVDRLGDAIVRLFERAAASSPGDADHVATVAEAVAGPGVRIDGVLALEDDALVVRRTETNDQRGGDTGERSSIALVQFDGGRITRSERFDTDDEQNALARLDEVRRSSDG
jgi:hypothetical protein